ncbi:MULTISPECIES: hypothetical protein [unclassified Endozoicomonas]|uniref:hypothetical protein n=1 Tax=unclassified Endozoicomonas TaxID=2644528 RepID=UPI0021489532|nr:MULTISPECIES: hypothetical protein [unclassified Endozoicomonas]
MFKFLSLCLSLIVCLSAYADDDELAKKLTNPVADLISMPVQANYDTGFGPDDGHRTTVNVQPVIPIEMNDDWNMVSRTILPLIEQNDVAGSSGSQSGTGDIVQSLFFSPKRPTNNGWIWGAGPVFLLPTASDELLGTEKWGLGPTAVLLKMEQGWSYGALANHIWDIAGEDKRDDVNASFIQPFLTYTHKGWTYTLQTESTYDWKNSQWNIPINAVLSKVIHIGRLPVSFAGGVRYWAGAPEQGAEGWGARFAVTAMLPR